jgi:hypothetical protein
VPAGVTVAAAPPVTDAELLPDTVPVVLPGAVVVTADVVAGAVVGIAVAASLPHAASNKAERASPPTILRVFPISKVIYLNISF